MRLGVSVLVLGALSVLVADQTFLRGETAALQAANDIPPAVGWPLRVVMQLGTLWVALGVVVVTALATRARGLGPALAVLVAVAVAFRLDNVLKEVIERPRPPGLVDGLNVRETIGGLGFPSGHATMAFALAASLHPSVTSRWRWVLWALAAVVGLARMHVGVHWPADIVGGAALGTAIGTTAWLLISVTFTSRTSRA